MKRTLIGFLWFFVLYLGACVIVGAIAGGIAGAKEKDPENAGAAGGRAGAEAVDRVSGYLLAGAILATTAGTMTGVLPGTRKKSPVEPEA